MEFIFKTSVLAVDFFYPHFIVSINLKFINCFDFNFLMKFNKLIFLVYPLFDDIC